MMKGRSHNADMVTTKIKSTREWTSEAVSDWKETETKVAQQAVFWWFLDTHD